MGLPAGASLAFFMASSNFLARMSSLLDSWNQESRNLSSRWRFCSARMPAASVRSTPGPALAGASCDRTTPRPTSILSFAWQQGQATSRAPSGFFAMSVFYLFFSGKREVGCCGSWLLAGLGKDWGKICATWMIHSEVDIVHRQECLCYFGPALRADVGSCPPDSRLTAT